MRGVLREGSPVASKYEFIDEMRLGLELVRRLMRELGLEPCQPRPKRFGLTQGTPAVVPDLVGRDFTADAPGEKLVGDITYISTGEGWLYLATVIDCCTKEVIGYAMDDHYQTLLISRAIRSAARKRYLHPDKRSVQLAGAALSTHLAAGRAIPDPSPPFTPRRHLRPVL